MRTPPKLALVGAGAWGQNLLRLAQARGVLAAIVDPSERALAQATQRAPQAPVFRSLDGLLRAGISLDAALIATPARSHYVLTRAALEAGLDVLVEKPLTVNSAEAISLVGLAQQRERILMVGHLLRYHPAIERLLLEVARGVIGRPVELFSWRRSPPGRPSDVNALWALAPHDLSLLLALDRGPIVAHNARSSSEQVSLRVEMASGLAASLMLSRCHPTKERHLSLVGEEAALFFDDLHATAPLRLQRQQGCRWVTEEVFPVEVHEPLACELDHFLDCVSRRQPPRTPGNDGAAVVRWLEVIDSGSIVPDARGPALPTPLEDPGPR